MTARRCTPARPGRPDHDRTALSGADRLLSDEGLSAVVGRPVQAVHERVKAGRSVLLAWQAVAADGSAPARTPLDAPLEEARHGWMLLTRDEDKIANARRRAARLGLADQLRVRPWDGGTTVLWGSVWTDPGLARPLARARAAWAEDGPEPSCWTVLRHNPRRRVVARVGDRVVRVHAARLDAADGMLATVARWGEAGVPVLALERLGEGGTAAASPFWGAGDLSALAAASAADAVPGTDRWAAAAGDGIAAAHALPAAGSLLPALIPDAPAAAEAVAAAVAGLGEAVRSAAVALQPLLEASCAQEPAVELHGDWSPDQVLVDPTSSAGPVRIIDLDRACTGPAVADLGSWNAACRREGLPGLAAAHADGHARLDGPADPVAVLAWEGYAQLTAAVDPLRRRQPDWAERLTARVAHLHACLRELEALQAAAPGDALPALSAAASPAGAAAAERAAVDAGTACAQLPPAVVEAEGTVWTVERCWPAGAEAGSLAVEVRAAGRLRAGRWQQGRLTLTPPEADPKLPALAPLLAAGGTVVSWRPARRAVVRTDGAAGAVFTKVVRPGRAAAVLDGIGRARAFEAGFRTPQVLDATDATVAFAALPGRSLHEASAFSDVHWSRAWEDVAAALRTARGLDPVASAVAVTPVHGPEQEAAALTDWLERTAAFTGARPAFVHAVEQVGEALRALPAAGTVPTHRDLHDKQLLWDPELGAGLLDVDTACLGDPALDLGNLRAHALWRRRQGVWSPVQSDLVRRTVDTLAAAESVPARRVDLYEQATLLRLRCVYALRPRYARAAAVLEAELLG